MVPTFLGNGGSPCTPARGGHVLRAGYGRSFLPSPFAPRRLLVGNSTTLSDVLMKHGANKHCGYRARELIMNRFMSDYSISASLPCSHTPQLQVQPQRLKTPGTRPRWPRFPTPLQQAPVGEHLPSPRDSAAPGRDDSHSGVKERQ